MLVSNCYHLFLFLLIFTFFRVFKVISCFERQYFNVSSLKMGVCEIPTQLACLIVQVYVLFHLIVIPKQYTPKDKNIWEID